MSAYRVNHSVSECLRSLFQLHNETFNVWLHLVGCMIFLALLFTVSSTPCEVERCPERWPLYAFVASALVCLSASCAYHLVGTANEKWSLQFEKWDYFGIGERAPHSARSSSLQCLLSFSSDALGPTCGCVPAGAVALIVGSCLPVVHYGFGEAYHTARTCYMLAIAAIGAGVTACSLLPWFDRWAWTRVLMFISLALCGVIALLHAMVAHDYSPRTVALLTGVLQMGATYLFGVFLYMLHVPESLVPRRFSRVTDIWGSSHQLWHACVLAAACKHFRTVLALWHATAHLPVVSVG